MPTHGSVQSRTPVDDSIPDDACGGYEALPLAPPPSTRLLGALPTANAVVEAMRAFLGIGEPGGDNCNAITDWFGLGCVPWCVEAVSKALVEAGFRDAEGNWAMPGIAPDYMTGFASVSRIRHAFEQVGRYDQNPRRGDVVICRRGDEHEQHACLLEWVNGDGTFSTIEGNFGNDCKLNNRTMDSIDGFCHPPYDGTPPPRILRRGDTGPDVLLLQTRLTQLGWTLDSDGDFGPLTEQAVIAFQQSRGLEMDGIVGPSTWNALFPA
jgi:hypothetical protein